METHTHKKQGKESQPEIQKLSKCHRKLNATVKISDNIQQNMEQQF